MHLFVAVARVLSFSQAAHELGMATSTLSRRIAEFERKAGTSLLMRNSYHMELTDDGREYFAHAEKLVGAALEFHEEWSHRRSSITGILRISVTECVALHSAAAWIAEFYRLHPNVRIQIDTDPERLDLLREGFDVFITLSRVDDSSYVRKTLASFDRQLFASPEYLREFGTPSTPADLAKHKCICTGHDRNGTSVWRLTRGSEKVSIEVTGPIYAVNDILAPELAKQGVGIGAGMEAPLKSELESGRLRRVLEDWTLEPVVLSLVRPNRMVTARARAFIEFITAKFETLAQKFGS